MTTVKAYHPVVTDKGWSIAIAVWGENGYHPTDFFFETEQEAEAFCETQNKNIGINKKQSYMIVAKTMFPGCEYTLEEVIRAGRES
jgi:hypothetical protein